MRLHKGRLLELFDGMCHLGDVVICIDIRIEPIAAIKGMTRAHVARRAGLQVLHFVGLKADVSPLADGIGDVGESGTSARFEEKEGRDVVKRSLGRVAFPSHPFSFLPQEAPLAVGDGAQEFVSFGMAKAAHELHLCWRPDEWLTRVR
jgi:hypothetical protein